MTRKFLPPLFLGMVAAWLVIASLIAAPAAASLGPAPVAQFTYIPTPTPGPDGRIVYIVQAGDSAWSIAARYGFVGDKYNELKALNKWGDNPILNEGDEVILGYAGPQVANPTTGPTATPQAVLPTPSPLPGKGELCVLLYDDVNGDSLRQEEEVAVAGGRISVSNRLGTVSKTADTLAGVDPVCFLDLPEGNYNISVGPPGGYNQTTNKDMAIVLHAGDKTTLDFGIQANSETEAAAPAAPDQPARSPLLLIAGGFILLMGGALGIFGSRLLSWRSKPADK